MSDNYKPLLREAARHAAEYDFGKLAPRSWPRTMLDLADAVNAVAAERDALRAQLAAMAVEWGTYVGGPFEDRDVWGSEDDARGIAREYGETLVKRRVSPWEEVERFKIEKEAPDPTQR